MNERVPSNGAGVIQINTMSSYSCRNRYGAKNAPLSQHAFANAIDVRGFITAKGQLIEVEQHWGPTTKELAAYAAAGGSTVPRDQLTPAPNRPTTGDRTTAPIMTGALATAGAEPKGWSTTIRPAPGIVPSAIEAARASSGTPQAALKPSFPVLAKAGPTSGESGTIKIVATGQLAHAGPAVQPGEPLDARAAFLREAWQGACGPFTTVLGPEANRAHRNHLHIDLAQRISGPFCQ